MRQATSAPDSPLPHPPSPPFGFLWFFFFDFTVFLIFILSVSRLLLERLEQPEEPCRLPNSAELDAEGLDFDEKVLNVDDLVSDQRLQEHAHEAHQPVLRE